MKHTSTLPQDAYRFRKVFTHKLSNTFPKSSCNQIEIFNLRTEDKLKHYEVVKAEWIKSHMWLNIFYEKCQYSKVILQL